MPAIGSTSSPPSSGSSSQPPNPALGHLKLKQTFSVLEAPVGYREYREGVTLLTSKMRAKVDVILALSEEKIEVYPKQQYSAAKFWKRQKSLSYRTEALVACEVLEKRANGKWLLRLVLVEATADEEGEAAAAAPAAAAAGGRAAVEPSAASASSHPHLKGFQVKKHDFECPEREAVEVHSKLNYLLAWQPGGEERHWYRKHREEKRLQRGHSWHLK